MARNIWAEMKQRHRDEANALVVRAVVRHFGNKQKAGEDIGMPHGSIRRRIYDYNLQPKIDAALDRLRDRTHDVV